MKYVIVIPDGCADEPQEALDGRTPLEAANVPNMDQVAAAGIVGAANHTPSHLPAGSAVANMSLLGYDPNENFTGRAPIEAAAQGIELGPHDWAVRCNLVTVTEQVMTSFTAGHISSEEAKELLAVAQANVELDNLEFVPGVSYRNLMLIRGSESTPVPFSAETRTTPLHDLSDKTIEYDFPRGPGSNLLSNLMSQSIDWFADHSINKSRSDNGKPAATNLWLWGLGQQPQLTEFKKLHNASGAMITAVDLLRGLAKLVGWDRIEVPGATGYTDTDFAAKGKYAIDAIDKYDLVCVHVEATDEASHEGDVAKKVEGLESIDREIVGPLLEHLRSTGDEWRMLISPDHPTFLRTKTHSHGDVPFTICGTGIEADSHQQYNELNAASSNTRYDRGFELMANFVSSASVAQ